MTLAQFTPLYPTLILALGSLVLLMVGAFTNHTRLTAWLTGGTIAAAAACILFMPAIGPMFPLSTGHLIHISPFTNLTNLMTLLASLLALPLFSSYFSGAHARYHKPELYVLLTLTLTGMMILPMSADLLTLYVALELMSFPLYILAAFTRDDAKSSEAALKYFVLGGLASGLTLFGIALLFAAAGTTSFFGLSQAFAPMATLQPLILLGFALTLIGTLFKLSVVPFHMWTPDVYEGAPTPVTAIMSALPKLAAFGLLIRLTIGPFLILAPLWQPGLALLSGASMLAGSVLAIIQTNLKRLLAFSTIANVGFIMAGVVSATPAGEGGALFYLSIYAVTTLGLFAAVIASGLETTTQLKGLAKSRPWLAATFMLLLFSLAGIPPLAGFMAKFTVFVAAVQAGYTNLAIVGVLASVVACFYSLWLIKLIYFEEPTTKTTTPQISPGLQAVLIVAAVLTLALGILPGIFSALTLTAATAIF